MTVNNQPADDPSSPDRTSGPDATDNKLRLEKLAKHYGSVVALAEIDLAVKNGEFLTLLGPSGSGKTTLLNLVAGMVTATSGRILVDGRDITYLDPNKRGLGMVFQNYALMPHMTVFENIAFPLRVRKVKEDEIKRRVLDVLDQVRLPEVAKRKPAELSGGQQQRVAIARCIVYNPSIILMDEPLGALDKKLREEMQIELKRLHDTLEITALYVTHDQEEALTMSDRIVLLNGGHIEQIGTPDELYFNPCSLFAAEFLGDSNIIQGTVDSAGPKVSVTTATGQRLACRICETQKGKDVKVMVRPENVVMLPEGETRENTNQLSAQMLDTISFGGVIKSYLKLPDGGTIVVQELTKAGRPPRPPGSDVTLTWSAEDTMVLPVPKLP